MDSLVEADKRLTPQGGGSVRDEQDRVLSREFLAVCRLFALGYLHTLQALRLFEGGDVYALDGERVAVVKAPPLLCESVSATGHPNTSRRYVAF